MHNQYLGRVGGYPIMNESGNPLKPSIRTPTLQIKKKLKYFKTRSHPAQERHFWTDHTVLHLKYQLWIHKDIKIGRHTAWSKDFYLVQGIDAS